jgi:hypothetical protein
MVIVEVEVIEEAVLSMSLVYFRLVGFGGGSGQLGKCPRVI